MIATDLSDSINNIHPHSELRKSQQRDSNPQLLSLLANIHPFSQSLAKWLSVCLQTKWLWVRISLLQLKRQIRLLQARSSLIFKQIIACGFTLKLVPDMIITYSLNYLFWFRSCKQNFRTYNRIDDASFSGVNFSKDSTYCI